MDRRKTGDVLFYALQCAKADRRSFVDAHTHMKPTPAVKDALADIRAFERLQIALFGTTRSELDVLKDDLQPIPIEKLRGVIGDLTNLAESQSSGDFGDRAKGDQSILKQAKG